MSVSYRILPAQNLVHVSYTGQIDLASTLERMAECAADPAFRPWMRHLVDLAAVTGFDRDFVGFLELQAKAITMFPQQHDMLLLFHAPTRIGQDMAALARRTWEGLDRVIVRVVTRESEALTLLGLPGTRLADLDEPAG